MTEHVSCHACDMRDKASDEQVVIRNSNWTVFGVMDAPGHLMVMTTAHDTGLASLSPSAAAEFGPLLQSLSAELIDDQHFDRTALLFLGDNSTHTHILLVARSAHDMSVADTAPLRERIGALRDADASKAIVARLRQAVATAQPGR